MKCIKRFGFWIAERFWMLWYKLTYLLREKDSGKKLSAEESQEISDLINGWIQRDRESLRNWTPDDQ